MTRTQRLLLNPFIWLFVGMLVWLVLGCSYGSLQDPKLGVKTGFPVTGSDVYSSWYDVPPDLRHLVADHQERAPFYFAFSGPHLACEVDAATFAMLTDASAVRRLDCRWRSRRP